MTIENYTKKIARHLLCSSTKKKEIIKQIQSDISIKLEEGVSPDTIIQQMGTPKDVAMEFNENFDDREKKKIKRNKRLIIAAAAVAAVVVVAVWVYWMLPKATDIKDSESFSAAEVRAKAEYIIEALNDKEYDVVDSNMSKILKDVMAARDLEKYMDDLCSDWGEFKAFGNCYITEVEQRGENFAMAQLNASYENISVTFTLTFDKDMKLAGIYLK